MESNIVTLVKTSELKTSAVHNSLYGLSEELDELFVDSIRLYGIKTPLLCSPEYEIISGVLRHRVAIKLGIEMVPVVFTEKPLEDYQIAMLNLGRKKLPSMILKEYQLLKPLFQVGKGTRTDIKNPKQTLDTKDVLGVSQGTVNKLIRIEKNALALYGTEDSEKFKDLWKKLDSGKVDVSRMEKVLKQKLDIKTGKEESFEGDYQKPGFKIIQQDSKNLGCVTNKSIQVIISSVPYYDKRDYEIGKEQLGQEKDPLEFVKNLANHFDECKRVLKDKGSLFVNIGDFIINRRYRLIPSHFAFAMQEKGWILNDHLIWSKNNPTPTSGKRTLCCTEHIFHFVLTTHFDYDLSWINELSNKRDEISGSGLFWGVGTENAKPRSFMDFRGHNIINSNASNTTWLKNECQKQGIPFTHSATFPEIIPEILIRTTSQVGDTVMDIFNGTATSGCVANVLKRNYLGFELNPAYIKQSIVRFESPQITEKNLLKVA